MKTERQSDKLRKELAQFVAKMQLEGIDIMAIKKPIDVGASISCVKNT